MSFGGPNQDVLSGQTPLRLSPVPGLSNASYIINRQYKSKDVLSALADGQNKKGDGFDKFGAFVRNFVKTPKVDGLSKAVALLNQGGKASGL